MKQLLFLLLFPCLCVAQYTGNAGQKITLGEQSTADGLVYRGLAADTTRKPSVDTMAFILLDTNTNIIWQYKKATNNAWTRVGGSISSGVTGVLPVANGGTGSATQNFVDLSTTQTVDGLKTFSNIFKSTATVNAVFSAQETGTAARYFVIRNTSGGLLAGTEGTAGNFLITGSPAYYGVIVARSGLLISADDATEHMRITSAGAVTISNLAGSGSRAVNASATGVLSASSSILIKENVENINYGLSDVLKLKPVIFNYIDKDKWGEGKELGFIAEDVMDIIPESTGTMNNSDIYFDLQKLIPVLTKAIQEQQALIKALEQRIINLENK